MHTLTTDDLLAAAAYAVAHPEEYDQQQWCGTACCVLGHARRRAGLPQLDRGLGEKEYPDPSRRAAMLRTLLGWTHADTAALMPHVETDGVLRVPTAIGAFGAGAWIGVGATVERGATVGAGATVERGATVGAGAWVGERARIGVGARIGERATVERGARIGERAWIGERATVRG